MAEALSLHQLLGSATVRLDGPRAQAQNFILDLYVIDREEHCRLIVSNGALIHRTGEHARDVSSVGKADFSCTLTYNQLLRGLATGQTGVHFTEEHGDRPCWDSLLSLLASPNPAFNIVTP